MKALIIFSGGQDSTTALYWALEKYEKVRAINFNYGQKHAVEIQQAKLICEKANVPLRLVDISFLPELVESALTSDGDVNVLNDKGLPASFVPNRNQLFITLAHAYAQKIGAEVLVTGVCQTDYSGYPDCRKIYIDAIQSTTNLGSMSNIDIQTPMMYLTKAETWQLADILGKLEEVRTMSHTCYNNDRTTELTSGFGCGICPACVLRQKGYDEFISKTKGKDLVS